MVKPRSPKRMTETALAEAAVSYLARFSTSSENLRRVLRRKIIRAARHYGDDPNPLLAAADTLVAQLVRKGMIDDAHYARSQTAALRRRGGSSRAIAAKLSQKGVDAGIQADILADRDGSADRDAAVRFARRRRLGPFRASGRTEHRLRDLAAMGRAGFDYRTASSVVDASDAEDLGSI